LVFVYVSEDLIMVNDVTAPSNLVIASIEDEEFKEASFV
jgi:hypothetical protein